MRCEIPVANGMLEKMAMTVLWEGQNDATGDHLCEQSPESLTLSGEEGINGTYTRTRYVGSSSKDGLTVDGTVT